ncbi:tape measure protein [uncultured Paraglaciecola sp.]|uniref:tape measure protein n=1 Tax=uncultured Paraglaciecola sp. TaxID=1765024 RepID=UPI00262D4FA3|nr:tape measure protein [uncultured Paraglaciecola sp.]
MAISTQETRFLLTAKDRTKVAFKNAKLNFKELGKSVTGVHAKLLGLAGIGGFGALLGGIVSTNTEMQTLKASLKTVTGSADAASKAFSKIEKFAITTPFDLNQWTEAFIKMKALGLDPSEAALTSYGNTASAMGKDLNQMIEAVADAATGEFERLKEFGIKAKSQGDQVSFTFQGVTTTVKKNAAEITGYLKSIGNENFGGAMNDQMNNLKPAFSNLSQAFQKLAVSIGEAGLNEMITGMATSMTAFVNSFSDTQLHTLLGFFKSIGSGLSYIGDLISLITDGWGRLIALGGGVLDGLMGSGSNFSTSGAAVSGYQPGDFNRSNGNADYLKTLRGLESKYGQKTADGVATTNNLLKEMTGVLKNQSNVAVAG